jgi:hypothetical protein
MPDMNKKKSFAARPFRVAAEASSLLDLFQYSGKKI